MDNDTTLLVFGDHGMTDDGNHGGASREELRSILFAYRKNKKFPNAGHPWSDGVNSAVK
jgi:phosphatidylinositol glycan class O